MTGQEYALLQEITDRRDSVIAALKKTQRAMDRYDSDGDIYDDVERLIGRLTARQAADEMLLVDEERAWA